LFLSRFKDEKSDDFFRFPEKSSICHGMVGLQTFLSKRDHPAGLKSPQIGLLPSVFLIRTAGVGKKRKKTCRTGCI